MHSRALSAFQAPKPSLLIQLREAQAQLDEVIGELEANDGAARNSTHFDELEERCNALCAGARRAFRGER
ncbi:hypothetical protein AAG607_12145 [Citromicrobium bathyomarinum]|uniref:hypothetical protein n=1 Tax=Citromicrobium bathyomarinum TaxID=72174 RepID=UPI00315A2A41